MSKKLGRLAFAVVAATAVGSSLAGVAMAIPVSPGGPRSGKLTQVGPIAEHGFPTWYRDSNDVRLELCTTMDDPLCPALADEVPDPTQPISFPDNFPGESFYQLDGADLTLTSGARAVIGLNLEGAFAADRVVDGDQMVFGRVRIRFDAPAGERYRITHPYGVDDIVATDKGVNMTEDTGAAAGAFGQALAGRVGPFLKWDPSVAPAAPAGYVGDPGVNHKVVGSPYNTNFVRIERLDPASGAVLAQVGYTDLFSIQGRYATNAGVDVDQATYSTDGQHGTLEVFATSEPGQAIEVTGNPALGFRTTRLRGGGNGRYYGRFPITGPVPPGTKIEVSNTGDRPVAKKIKTVVDVVRIEELGYDADAGTLTVKASSSDRTGPALSVTGFGPITGSPFTGVLAPPPAVTVTSAAGGSTTVPLIGTGGVFLPAAPVAAATLDSLAVVGQTVRLDGSGSVGEIDAYSWTQTGGPSVTLTGATERTATFTPAKAGDYTFTLDVAGPGGAGAKATVTFTVADQVAAPKAIVGADQTVTRGRSVTVDGSGSTGVESYAWRQVSGPQVTLSSTTTAKPSFTYPAQALPAAPGPNAGYLYNNDPVVLELTVRNSAGSDVVRTTVRPTADQLTNLSVRFRTDKDEWRISGTDTLVAGQMVTAVLGSTLTGRVIGTPVAVDATGAFSIRVNGPALSGSTTISLVTTTGGRLLAQPVTVTN
ncbi:PKD domain-containing protein [Actinoplanes sp. KI2]|uniref:PKD domain-containing protein n=1 Tax=Actinoplanes sp. KI2 TaxID=2983315 RepID=UPI0021D5CBCD|nr:PKD domain-containing protein [Actinoplanes sp. KI2]MCU7723598.1 PKD domain-containing protein [Actinoplanes sp. KI2]